MCVIRLEFRPVALYTRHGEECDGYRLAVVRCEVPRPLSRPLTLAVSTAVYAELGLPGDPWDRETRREAVADVRHVLRGARRAQSEE